MKLNLSIWITDPKSKQKSVSLTMLVLSTIMYVGAIVATVADLPVDANLIQQFWIGSSTLYFARKVKFSKDGTIEAERDETDAR